jgi:hypothetical protein
MMTTSSESMFEPLTVRSGTFGKYAIYGIPQRETRSGKIDWLVELVWSEGFQEKQQAYWVDGSEFRVVLHGNLLSGLRPISEYTLGEVVDPPEDQKETIEQAISKWSSALK